MYASPDVCHLSNLSTVQHKISLFKEGSQLKTDMRKRDEIIVFQRCLNRLSASEGIR